MWLLIGICSSLIWKGFVEEEIYFAILFRLHHTQLPLKKALFSSFKVLETEHLWVQWIKRGAGPQVASFSESILMIDVKCHSHQITLSTKFWRDRWCDRLELGTDFTNILCVIHCNWRLNYETEPRIHRNAELGDTWCLGGLIWISHALCHLVLTTAQSVLVPLSSPFFR